MIWLTLAFVVAILIEVPALRRERDSRGTFAFFAFMALAYVFCLLINMDVIKPGVSANITKFVDKAMRLVSGIMPSRK